MKQAPSKLAVLAASCCFTLACTPMRSTLPPPYPYQGQQLEEPEMQALAAEQCTAGRTEPERPLPAWPFTTDGCSMVPDGNALACCIEHDVQYWCGGSLRERKAADLAFRECLTESTGPLAAGVMFVGVRIASWPRVPFGWRWGYGYAWPHAAARSSSVAAGDSAER